MKAVKDQNKKSPQDWVVSCGTFFGIKYYRLYLYGYGIQITKIIYKKRIITLSKQSVIIPVDNRKIYSVKAMYYNASTPRSPVRIRTASQTS